MQFNALAMDVIANVKSLFLLVCIVEYLYVLTLYEVVDERLGPARGDEQNRSTHIQVVEACQWVRSLCGERHRDRDGSIRDRMEDDEWQRWAGGKGSDQRQGGGGGGGVGWGGKKGRAGDAAALLFGRCCEKRGGGFRGRRCGLVELLAIRVDSSSSCAPPFFFGDSYCVRFVMVVVVVVLCS